jgi:hypothetical protein
VKHLVLFALLAALALASSCWRTGALDSNTAPDADADTDTDIDADVDSDSDSDSDTDADTDTDSATVPEQCVYRVDASTELGGDGLTWDSAFDTVEQGLIAAEDMLSEFETCQVWVAAGTYYIYDSDHYDTVLLRPNVELYGGFAGNETSLDERDPEANETILDGHSGPGPTVRVYHVVTGANDTLIDGFTITGGWANGAELDGRGGGMLNSNCSPTVVNCRFVQNYACEDYACVGGGMHNAFADPEVVDCEFVNNTAGIGGGMGNLGSYPTVTNCVFDDNATFNGSGAGMHNAAGGPTVTGCVFEYNTATLNGGAVVNHSSAAAFTDCMFDSNNTENNAGGAMFNYSDLAEVTVEGCSFYSNQAATNGGAVASIGADSVVITGSTFGFNSAGEIGGAIYNYDSNASFSSSLFDGNSAEQCGALHTSGVDLTVANNVFTANHAEGGIGGAICNGDELVYSTELEVINCTFYNNSTGEAVDGMGVSIASTVENATTAINCIFSETEPGELYGSLVTAHHSLISNAFEGEGNIDADPLFVDADDFHLQPGSPCIDAADSPAAPELDFDGSERVDDADTPNTGIGPPWADMGAYEYQP